MPDKNDTSLQAANPATVFLPLRGRIIGLIVGGSILAAFALPLGGLAVVIAWARVTVPADKPSSGAVVVAAVLMALALFLGLLASWLFLLAARCRRMQMELSSDGLHLTTSLYEWFLWNPWGIREARLRWDEIKGIRLWRIPNNLAPGGVQENYILYTAQGDFVLSSVVWPHPEQMAAAIAQRIGGTIASSLDELPAELAAAAQPSRKERIGARLLRGLGWVSTVLGVLLLGISALFAVTGQEWSGGLSSTVLATVVFLTGGYALRRFRLE
ncbi:MAG TPA: hypothetical protein VG056_04165 [Pirellulales bacterium]|nr:hypothetical protein [Pirellulales bacterium]